MTVKKVLFAIVMLLAISVGVYSLVSGSATGKSKPPGACCPAGSHDCEAGGNQSAKTGSAGCAGEEGEKVSATNDCPKQHAAPPSSSAPPSVEKRGEGRQAGGTTQGR